MPIALILSVGEDPDLLESRSSVLRGAGHVVRHALSIQEAMGRFQDGDFDLVLVCHSLPAQDRVRLIRSIRASSSLTPIIFTAAMDGQVPDLPVNAIVDGAPRKLLACIDEILRKETKFQAEPDRGMPDGAGLDQAKRDLRKRDSTSRVHPLNQFNQLDQ
ncbi:MAG: response regulator [Terriglobia bacterium]